MTSFEDYHGQVGEYVECADCGATVYTPPWSSISDELEQHVLDGMCDP